MANGETTVKPHKPREVARRPQARTHGPKSDPRTLAMDELLRILRAPETASDPQGRDLKIRAAQVVLRLDQAEQLAAMSDEQLAAHLERVEAEAQRRGLLDG